MAAAALGLFPHTGWAWLVRLGGTAAAPVIEARAKVVAIEVVGAQIYHRAAEEKDPERFLARERAAALKQTRAALREHLGRARRAVVLGKVQTALPQTERIVAVHPMIHTAEGELWRALFAEACAAAGLEVRRVVPDEIQARFAAATRAERFLAEAGRTVGPPWNRELKDAALAAWSVL